MKAREIREKFKGKIDPSVLYVLEALAEDNAELKQAFAQLANSHTQLVTLVGQFVTIADNMKKTVTNLQKRGERDGVSVQSIPD